MSLRFRRSLKIAPGIRLNFGKKGISASIGPRGAKITIGETGIRKTVGLPGTGLSYISYERYKQNNNSEEIPYTPSCPRCGHHMRKPWANCPKCGYDLLQSQALHIESSSQADNKDKISGCGCLCMVILFVIIGLYLW